MKNRSIVSLTDNAILKLEEFGKNLGPDGGLRLSIKTKGCSGYSYDLTKVDHKNPGDEVVIAGKTNLFVDPAAIMFVIGMNIDWKVDKLEEGFSFSNPNEVGRCGCGESFTV